LIELRVEEVGVYFLAAAVLVVLAFLMGWYGRGVSLPGPDAPGQGGRERKEPARRLLSVDGPTAHDLGRASQGVRRLGHEGRDRFSILVACFGAGGSGEAERHRRSLEANGFTPAWTERVREGIELRVGRFETERSPLLIRWLRKLGEQYPGCRVAPLR
jgi:hypothetical protein